MQEFILNLPKAELHIHIEGSVEPRMLLTLAKRNNIVLPYTSIEAVKGSYKFEDLQSFLDLYYQGMSVLVTEQDFYDLMLAYIAISASQNVTHAEIFFDPQAHLSRGIAWHTFMNGFMRAIKDGNMQFGFEAKLILCFLRHLPEYDALKTFDEAMEYRDCFIGVGLDSSELGFPPVLFKNVFRRARDSGLFLTAHAGEEAPAKFVWETLDILGVQRIDHGTKAIEDLELVRRLARDKITLTSCPLSNLCLKNTPDLSKHPIKQFLDLGVVVTINSDDPAYFGGYINENYLAIANALNLSREEIRQLAQNSFTSLVVNKK